jgi:hypothetical protein
LSNACTQTYSCPTKREEDLHPWITQP